MVQAKFWIDHRKSLSSRRAWIEICTDIPTIPPNVSLSSRRAWIEISREVLEDLKDDESLSSRRAWIEISAFNAIKNATLRRSPHGERGLKCLHSIVFRKLCMSLSSRRAWIEIFVSVHQAVLPSVALLTESVD